MIYLVSTALVFALFSIGFMGWYIRNLLGDLVFLSASVDDLKHNVKVYEAHLEELTKMEVFSDEPVIKGLYEHTQDMVEFLSGIDNVFVPTEDETIETEEED